MKVRGVNKAAGIPLFHWNDQFPSRAKLRSPTMALTFAGGGGNISGKPNPLRKTDNALPAVGHRNISDPIDRMRRTYGLSGNGLPIWR